MKFQDALNYLLDNKKVRRKCWSNGLYLMYGNVCNLFIVEGYDSRCLSINEKFSIQDCLAEDWEVFELPKQSNEDYIIICDDGSPLRFTEQDDTIVVYGDKAEADEDTTEGDIGIATLQYGKNSQGQQEVSIYEPKTKALHGTFTYEYGNEEDFQKCLKSFIKCYPFKV